MRAASEDSSDIDDDTRVSATDRRDALRILLSLICDLKAKSTAISEGAIAPVGFMMEADLDEGVRACCTGVRLAFERISRTRGCRNDRGRGESTSCVAGSDGAGATGGLSCSVESLG